MTVDIQKLKHLALAQPEKVWHRVEGEPSMMTGERMFYIGGAGGVSCWEHGARDRVSAAYIEAVCPAAVLELIALMDEQDRIISKLVDQCLPVEEMKDMPGYSRVLTAEALLVERDRLKAENERLQRFETAYKEFSDKTDWVQETGHWSELGMHRADVLRKRCDDFASHVQVQADQLKKLMAENEELVTALNDILRVTSMGVEAFGIAALALGELGVSKEADNG